MASFPGIGLTTYGLHDSLLAPVFDDDYLEDSMGYATSNRQERAHSNASHRSDTSRHSRDQRSREPSRPRVSVPPNTSASSTAGLNPSLDPNLVAEVTKQVLATLKANGASTDPDGSTDRRPVSRQSNASYHPMSPPSADATQQKVQPVASDTSPSSANPRGRYTPPSCESDVSSPEPMSCESGAQSGNEDTTKSRRRGTRPSNPSSPERDRSKPRSKSRLSQADDTAFMASDTTLLEKIWQPLFDHDGRPTARLGAFLRGIAKHLIDELEPKNSIVIAPAKLATFFELTSAAQEVYPWKALFGGRLSNAAISKLYRDLRCNHHLVQANPSDPPSIPGLTPEGLEAFFTILIQAQPDQEFSRFAIAVRDMPINSADDLRERFPKQLVRRLFPARTILQKHQQLSACIAAADSSLQLDGYHMPPPPPLSTRMPDRSSGDTKKSASSSSAREDTKPKPNGIKIERDRRPYTVQEGQGKQYGDGERHVSSGSRTSETTSNRPTRSNSATPMPDKEARPRPTEIPASRRSHRMSMYGACTGIPARYGDTLPAMSSSYTHEQPMLGSSFSKSSAIPTYPPQASSAMPEPLASKMDFSRRPLRRGTDDVRNGGSSNLRTKIQDGQPTGPASAGPATNRDPGGFGTAGNAGSSGFYGSGQVPLQSGLRY